MDFRSFDVLRPANTAVSNLEATSHVFVEFCYCAGGLLIPTKHRLKHLSSEFLGFFAFSEIFRRAKVLSFAFFVLAALD